MKGTSVFLPMGYFAWMETEPLSSYILSCIRTQYNFSTVLKLMHNLLFVGGREDDCFWPNYRKEFVFPCIKYEDLQLKKRMKVKYVSLHKEHSPVSV